MDRLREEVEKAKQLQSQKETLEQKLEVKASYITSGAGLLKLCIKQALASFATPHSTFVLTHNLGHRCEEQGPGGAVSWCGAAPGDQPAGAGELPQEPQNAVGDLGQQDLRADRDEGQPGQTHRGQLEQAAFASASENLDLRGTQWQERNAQLFCPDLVVYFHTFKAFSNGGLVIIIYSLIWSW